MERITSLPRIGMVDQAFDFILEKEKSKKYKEFKYTKEDYERIKSTRVYTPTKGTTSKQWINICNEIENYLNKYYIMFFEDVTEFGDKGSRDEEVYLYDKKQKISDMDNKKKCIKILYR